MIRPALGLGLAAVAVLAVSAPAAAFPIGPLPHIKLPPVKLPPSPVIRQLWPYVGWVNVPVPGPTTTHAPEGSHATGNLRDALRDTNAARAELADKHRLHLSDTQKKVKAAAHIVAHHKRVATTDKHVKQADHLDAIDKDLLEAERQIADHQVDKAREALGRAAHGLEALVNSKKAPAKKKN